MRLWSLHPKYLDSQGLVALWREALLAQAVLRGNTRGYRNHPQLERFRGHAAPVDAIALYLKAVHTEAELRGYSFDKSKFTSPQSAPALTLTVTSGQMAYEWAHLLAKLQKRSPDQHLKLLGSTEVPEPHPLFTVCAGAVAAWERP